MRDEACSVRLILQRTNVTHTGQPFPASLRPRRPEVRRWAMPQEVVGGCETDPVPASGGPSLRKSQWRASQCAFSWVLRDTASPIAEQRCHVFSTHWTLPVGGSRGALSQARQAEVGGGRGGSGQREAELRGRGSPASRDLVSTIFCLCMIACKHAPTHRHRRQRVCAHTHTCMHLLRIPASVHASTRAFMRAYIYASVHASMDL